MTAPRPIELIRVRGSHSEVGFQIGERCSAQIRDGLERVESPAGRTREEQLALAARYREVTASAIPWLVEELDGVARGADVDPLDLFASGIEEITYEPRLPKGKCSDLVAIETATTDGHRIVGHNNDLYARDEDPLVAIEWAVDGEPIVFTIGEGPYLSVGFNSEGISFTGNELSPNDERIGVPRLMQFRAMLAQPSVEEAMKIALHPDRASSYNHVVVPAEGDALNFEGSATDAEITGPDEKGVFAHTNHYACERMLPFEGDDKYVKQSAVRLGRARELLSASSGTITVESMREMLSDHENSPDSLCRHPAPDDTEAAKTVFWIVCDVTDMRVLYGRGNPCDSVEQEYVFEDA